MSVITSKMNTGRAIKRQVPINTAVDVIAHYVEVTTYEISRPSLRSIKHLGSIILKEDARHDTILPINNVRQ